MQDFAAIDFETANEQRCSVCALGLVIYRNGQYVTDFYSLIKPTPNYFSYTCINVHGITPAQVANAPLFPEVWQQVEPLIADLPLVAHNSSFDSSCLKKVFMQYGMLYPDYQFLCTMRAARKKLPHLSCHKLNYLASYYHLKLNHHHALSDAQACAELALRLL